MSVSILIGDMRERLKELPDASVDSVVCDPPYGLEFMGKEWDKFGDVRRANRGAVHNMVNANGKPKFKRGQPAFDLTPRGRQTFQEFNEQWAREVLRVLKPGGHLVAFSGTRTYHRMVVAIEDAGFEVRDQLAWVYGSGFPKSLDVSKAIDKAAGKLEAQSVGFNVAGKVSGLGTIQRPELRSDHADYQPYAPKDEAAQQWQGWGTALKPSWEPICLARKPLIGSVASNVLTHGTGALNIDATRIETTPGDYASGGQNDCTGTGWGHKDRTRTEQHPQGRWPANLCHDGSDEVVARFPAETGVSAGTQRTTSASWLGTREKHFDGPVGFGDSGSAARFFYCAKATTDERGEGNNHPTVKPVALMRWLVRLVTPPGGTVLDPFMGSGSTLIAADAEQFNAIGIEMSPEYAAIAEKRIRDAAGMFADVKVAA